MNYDIVFYPGLHHASMAQHFDRCCIHVGILKNRRKSLGCKELLLDSQAFMKLKLYGGYPESPQVYVDRIHRIAMLCPGVTPVTEDYMCEPFMLAATGKNVAEHQDMTIARYEAIRSTLDSSLYLMPVLQGYTPREYAFHLRLYGDLIPYGAWVGVGSVCKRNTDPAAIKAVLSAIKAARPDLRLHGFGVKITALKSSMIRGLLHSADSMAWSFAERRNGGNANDWRAARRFEERINYRPGLGPLFEEQLCGT